MHNEEGNVLPLYQDISKVLAEIGRRYEVIFVNDLSSDATLKRMKEIHCRDPRFHFVDLKENAGENWALLAGVSKARGDVLVTAAEARGDDRAVMRTDLEAELAARC